MVVGAGYSYSGTLSVSGASTLGLGPFTVTSAVSSMSARMNRCVLTSIASASTLRPSTVIVTGRRSMIEDTGLMAGMA